MRRHLLAEQALARIPKILTLLDRNPHSPTYGCFDRAYWHYRIIDFPSGMSQEFVWPLALACQTDVPHNPYYRDLAIQEWVQAGIRFASRSSHPDGSCDDYFPFERATGASAFALLSCLEAYGAVGMQDADVLRFFERRATWLANHQESGRLTNHSALIALCLALAARLLGTDRWRSTMQARLDQVLSWQDGEGWFQEYEGCDPGYQTLTISLLARLLDMEVGGDRLRASLGRAVEVAGEFVHPDGSFGGEYGSRNTYGFFPHGFELCGRWMPEALRINDRFLAGLCRSRESCFDDDHLIGHHAWNYLLAWRDFAPERPPVPARAPGRVWLRKAGILIDRREGTELYLGLNKGGVFKLFRGDTLVTSDTQVSIQVGQGSATRNAVAHLVDAYECRIDQDEIVIEGRLGWAKQDHMTTTKLFILRAFMLTLGRFFPNLIRRLLQRRLITGKRAAPFSFTRRFQWQDQHWRVRDEVRADDWSRVTSVGLGAHQTSIYVAMSRTFQVGQLAPWLDLTARASRLEAGEPLTLERVF